MFDNEKEAWDYNGTTISHGGIVWML